MHERQKVTAIPLFHNKVNKEKLTQHKSVVEANTSSEAGTSSEERISLSLQRWNVPSSLVELYSNIPSSSSSCFPLLLPLEVRVFEADRSARLNFSLIELQLGSSSSCHCCFLSDRALTQYKTVVTFAAAKIADLKALRSKYFTLQA